MRGWGPRVSESVVTVIHWRRSTGTGAPIVDPAGWPATSRRSSGAHLGGDAVEVLETPQVKVAVTAG